MRRIVLLTTLSLVVQTVRAGNSQWKSQVLFECEHGLGGAAIGDLDPDTPGNEVVTVNAAGEVWLVRRAGHAWHPERIYAGDGELIMCAIGDVDPRYDGNEFVGVGIMAGEESLSGQGQVLLIRKDANEWVAESIFKDDRMLHGVSIGDVSTRHERNEIVTCGFSHRVTLLHFERDGWTPETIYVGNDRLKIALAADVLPERQGMEVVSCGSDGNVVVSWEGKLGWHHEIIFADPIGQSRIAIGDGSILVGGDKGKVTLCKRDGTRWLPEFVMRDTGKIRGVAVADIDPVYPDVELYACGYSTNVTQLVCDDKGFWTSKVVYTARHPLHHLIAGEFDPRHPGPELITCGHGGRLIALFPSD